MPQLSFIAALATGAVLSVVVPAQALAQSYSAPGMGSGTSTILLPSTATIPSSHFRVQGSRLQPSRTVQHASTMIDIAGGFSRYLEIYFNLSLETIGGESDNDLFGAGAKLRIPEDALFGVESALWWETARGGSYAGAAFEPSSLTRTGLVVNTGMGDVTLMLTGGVTIGEGRVRPLAGVAGTYPVSSSLLVSAELNRGYYGTDDYMVLMGGAVRLLPNISMQASPGYIWNGRTGGFTLLAGLCISTAAMDFLPAVIKEEGSGIPSIEEIERMLKEE